MQADASVRGSRVLDKQVLDQHYMPLFDREDFSGQWAPDMLAWLGNVAAHGVEFATMDRIRGVRRLPKKVLVALAISRYRPERGTRGEAISRLILRGARAVLGSRSRWPSTLEARLVRKEERGVATPAAV